MTYYEFRDDETGGVVEVEIPMAEVPSWGETITIAGRRLTRIVPTVVARVHKYDEITVWSQAPWKGPGPDPRGFKHHDAVGHPIITAKSQIDEVQSRTADTPERLVWSRDF